MLRMMLFFMCLIGGLGLLKPAQDSYIAVTVGVALIMLAGAVGDIFEVH